jgi:hypothetical protein
MYEYATPFREIEREISAGNLEKALNSLIEFSEKLIAEPRIVASVFGSRKLDEFCQLIGAKSWNNILPDLSWPVEPGAKIAIVATEVYRSGGHTAVIKDLIKAYQSKGEELVVLIVDTLQTANHVEITAALEGVRVVFAPKGLGTFERLIWLQKQIVAERPRQTFLFNHMQDAVIVAAFQPEMSFETSFFHHSDHRFSLGVFLPYVKHIDFREPGLENCRHTLGLENNWLLPLTNPDISGGATRNKFFSSGALRTCTTGSYKFDSPYAFSLGRHIVTDIIAATGGSHLHIGPLSTQNVQAIRSELEERKIPQDRFILVEIVNSLWSAMEDWQVDLYIDSFPVCGCRSVVEVMGAGVPIVVHENYKSRLLSNKGFVYQGAFSWREPRELIGYLRKLDEGDVARQSYLARKHYEQHHTPQAFSLALAQFESGVSPSTVPINTSGFLKDECFEFFEYEARELNVNNPKCGEENDSIENLRHALRTVMPARSKDGLDKEQFSQLLFNAAKSKTDGRARLSEALLHVANIAYPDTDTAPDPFAKETVSDFLFRFSVNAVDADIDILELDSLPIETGAK